jgi:hypothetical protein
MHALVQQREHDKPSTPSLDAPAVLRMEEDVLGFLSATERDVLEFPSALSPYQVSCKGFVWGFGITLPANPVLNSSSLGAWLAEDAGTQGGSIPRSAHGNR